MAPRSASVHIPQPCAESWAAMTPQGPGRHCAACQKTVVDFTQMSDAEILAVLTQATHGTCGRFRAEQLARPLLPLAVRGPGRWRAWLAAAGAVWVLREGVGAPARAQAAVEQMPSTTEQKAGKVMMATPAAMIHLIKGTVVNDKNEGLLGAIVLIDKTNAGISTDASGRFVLPVAATSKQITLLIKYTGYKTIRRCFFISETYEPIIIKLEVDEQALKDWNGMY